MKMQEFVNETKRTESENGGFYANRKIGLMDMHSDLLDAIEEGYIEGLSVSRPKGGKMEVNCEDGLVTVLHHDGLYFDMAHR